MPDDFVLLLFWHILFCVLYKYKLTCKTQNILKSVLYHTGYILDRS